MKKCSLCKNLKLDTEYNTYRRKGIPFLNSRCKDCEKSSRRERVANNPKINIDRKILAREKAKTKEGKYKTLIQELNKKKIFNDFSLEDYLSLENEKCEYCKSDRDSVCPRNLKVGYISNNLQPVCTSCKRAKSRCESDEIFQSLMIRRYGTTPEKQLQLNNMIGQKFNLLKVVSIGDKVRGHYYLNCICSCGKTAIVREKQILTGSVKSCGCLSKGKGDYLSNQKYKKTLDDPMRRYKSLKSSSRARNIVNILTFEEYEPLYYLDCFYCGQKNTSKGLDRIDNSKGYEFGNVVSCCKICNSMKNTLSYDEFINHIKLILMNKI